MCFLVAGVLTGCTPDERKDTGSTSTTPTSTARSTTTSISTPPSTPPQTSPPPITRPLDPSRYASERTVCDLLTEAQAMELGLPSPGDPSSIEGTFLSCHRRHALADREVNYDLWLDSDLLGSTYRGLEEYEDWELRDIAGQPAVVIGADPARACRVDIGLGKREGIELMASDDDGKACAVAVAVAEQIVRNLAGDG
ncbi:DUF3558 family protein [Actinophytocola sp.]|uniref:DUF3558 family protein n=1 Tax=Actinophytocola sp. TaxID=1872138 RepID=UPI0025BC3464|nr:DUF3558 family protein [Actinophytocola sp.]